MPFPLAVKPRAVIEPLQFQSMAGPALLRSVMFSRVRLELPLPPPREYQLYRGYCVFRFPQ